MGKTLFKDAYAFAIHKHTSCEKPAIMLTNSEQEDLAKLPQRHKKARIAGRIAAKKAIRKYYLKKCGIKPCWRNINIHNDLKGAPLVDCIISDKTGHREQADKPLISIAHSGEYAVAGVIPAAYGSIGVDVEKIRHFSHEFEKRFMTVDELQSLSGTDREERARKGTILWSCKEAYLKAVGKGLRADPHLINICNMDGKGNEARYELTAPNNTECKFTVMEICRHYIIAIAVITNKKTSI